MAYRVPSTARPRMAAALLLLVLPVLVAGPVSALSDDQTTTTEPGATPPVDPDDPMSNEAPGEEAPATDITVPPKETYGGQDPFEPAQILWSSVAAAERKLADAERVKRDAIVEIRHLRKRMKRLARDQQALGEESVAAIDELDATIDRLATRAVFGYQRFGSGSDDGGVPQDPSDYQEVVDAQRRSRMIASALEVDGADLKRLGRLESSLSVSAASVLERSRFVADHLAEMEAGVADLDEEIDQSAIEYEAFKAGSEIFIHGVVFPIAGPYPTPITDSFGFPRMPGTPDEHWHEGIDLFASRGTPLVATERGVITKVGVGRLGGLKFWLKGESGSEWYYAHLDSFAPGLSDGLVVEAGQLVGYVGNTGNAVGTPPHLHMQLHPDGGRPVNPYPLLKVVTDLEMAQLAAGTHPGWEHLSVTVDQPEPEPEPEPEPDSEPEPEPVEDRVTVAPPEPTTSTSDVAPPTSVAGSSPDLTVTGSSAGSEPSPTSAPPAD